MVSYDKALRSKECNDADQLGSQQCTFPVIYVEISSARRTDVNQDGDVSPMQPDGIVMWYIIASSS